MRSFNELELRGYLKDEYLLLQDHYEDFDRRTLTIKGWVGTSAFAALAVSFGISSKYAYIFPLMAAALAGVFWYLEAYWKLFQQATADRIRIIEATSTSRISGRLTGPVSAGNRRMGLAILGRW